MLLQGAAYAKSDRGGRGDHLAGRTVDTYFAHPSGGKAPGVIMWPDIFGLRPAFREMADRLAADGWVPPDTPRYDEAQAEKAWSRLRALFERALA